MFNKTAFNHVLALVWMGQDVLFMTGTTLDTLCCFKSGVTHSAEMTIWIFFSLSQWSLVPNIFHRLLHVHLLMLFVNCPLWKNFNFSFIQLIKILSDCLHTENYFTCCTYVEYFFIDIYFYFGNPPQLTGQWCLINPSLWPIYKIILIDWKSC